MPGTERVQPRVTRRTIARGAVWTAPIVGVAVAAPAFATSPVPCQVQTNFDNLQVGSRPTVLTFLPSTITASISWAANYSSPGDPTPNTPGDTGLVARTTTSPAWNYLECEMLDPITAGHTVTLSIHLSAPVTNLGFRIHDIDKTGSSNNYGWDDYVIVNTPGKVFTAVKGSNVIGNGSATIGSPASSTGPFRNNVFGDQAIDSGLNHVDLKWAGPIQDVQIIYKGGHNGDSANQHIGIGNISFSDCVANPGGRSASFGTSGADLFTPSAGRQCVPGRDN